jgi:hypothetical protein
MHEEAIVGRTRCLKEEHWKVLLLALLKLKIKKLKVLLLEKEE